MRAFETLEALRRAWSFLSAETRDVFRSGLQLDDATWASSRLGTVCCTHALPYTFWTQTAACLIAGLGEQVPGGVVIEEGVRSHREDEWRAAYRKVGKGDLASLRETDPWLVDQDSAVLAKGLRRPLDRLEDGERALAVGHSPTFEAAIFGLTGKILAPLGKGEGVLLIQDGDTYTVEPLSRGPTG